MPSAVGIHLVKFHQRMIGAEKKLKFNRAGLMKKLWKEILASDHISNRANKFKKSMNFRR